jgi:hypothetical protein
MSSLTERAKEFIEFGPYGGVEVEALIRDCVTEGSVDGLCAVQVLFKSMYGGFTFNFELKAPAAFSLVRWGSQGLQALVEAATPGAPSKTLSLAVEILATLASGAQIPQIRTWIHDSLVADKVLQSIEDWPVLFAASKRHLKELFLSFEDEEHLASLLGLAFSKASMTNVAIAKEIFSALSSRWLAINSRTLEEFNDLLRDHGNEEGIFQHFLEKHPQLIDPLAFEVWPQPDIHGFKVPDFLIKRADNSYLVVEIETPAKNIITSANQLSAEATHAVSQAVDYVEYLVSRGESLRSNLPDFSHPDGLVVIGLEGRLNGDQARALQRENRTRHGVRIVGFDQLAERAKSIVTNVVTHGVAVTRGLRIV